MFPSCLLGSLAGLVVKSTMEQINNAEKSLIAPMSPAYMGEAQEALTLNTIFS